MSKLLQSADASTASGLQGALDDLTQSYAAAQTSQVEREAELKGLLPRLESYERLGTDLQVFTHSRVKALSPGGQPDRSVEDYRQTVEVRSKPPLDVFVLPSPVRRRCMSLCVVSQEVKSELEQEAAQLKSFCSLGSELSTAAAFGNTQRLLEKVREVSEDFNQLQENVNERWRLICS